MKTNWYSMVSQMQVCRNSPLPVEYVLGGTFFCGEWFIVSPDVLIPRYETETLVDYVPNKIARPATTGAPKSQIANIKVLDLGTGCGNIAIILAKRLNSRVYAVDISGYAIKVAKKNARIHGVSDRIKFFKSDWYKNLSIEPIDLIVSNPPYISEEELDLLPQEVKDYEPKIALNGGGMGLDHYKTIIKGAKNMLTKGGRIVLEIGHNQAEEVKKLLEGFTNIEVIKDCYGNDRVVSAVTK